jgi:A-factor biosynthesis hotdog domain
MATVATAAKGASWLETASRLSFQNGVPRELVHRRGVVEVLITDSLQVNENEFLLGAQLPRAHSTWSDCEAPYYDSLAAIEAGRQAGVVVAHRYYGVPLGSTFIARGVSFAVTAPEALRNQERAPLEGVLHVRLADRQERDGTLMAATFEGELIVDGAATATMTAGVMFLQGAEYAEMRAYLRSQKPLTGERAMVRMRPVQPALVGRRDDKNVVIADVTEPATDQTCRRYVVIADTAHPCFFDHPQDHLPGPLLLEACRQAAVATAARDADSREITGQILGCQIDFAEFAELEGSVECVATVSKTATDGSVDVTVQIDQFGKQIGRGTVTLGVRS